MKNDLTKKDENVNKLDYEHYDQDLLTTLTKNRVLNSKVDFSKEDPKERLKMINTLFKVFIGVFGRQFSDQYCNDFTKDIWFNALLVFKNEDIYNAIELVLQDEYVTPPNLKRFIQYCKQKSQKNINQLPRLTRGKNNY